MILNRKDYKTLDRIIRKCEFKIPDTDPLMVVYRYNQQVRGARNRYRLAWKLRRSANFLHAIRGKKHELIVISLREREAAAKLCGEKMLEAVGLKIGDL